jgi:hypothetical protein
MTTAATNVHLGNSLQKALDNVFGYLPNIVGFLVILLVGYIIAKIVKAVVNKALTKAKVDDRLTESHAGNFVEKVSPGGKPSRIVGGVAFWLIFLYALTAAIGALKIPAVTSFINQVLAYLPNVIAAVLIFVVASVIATAVVAAVQRTMGDTPTGKVVETVVPGLVMAIAAFMILTQLRIAPVIVTITYAALIGMLALAGALAFGLGGRDVAARLLQSAYESGQSAKDQASQDIQKGKSRAKAQAQEAYPDEQPTGSTRRRSTTGRR